MTLTAQGFKRKRYEEFIVELEEQARELWGADVNLTDRSPLGQWIKLLAYQRAEENELQEDVYNADYVDTAEGVSLDHVGKRIGISRIPEDFSKVTVEITVDPGVVIPTGFNVGTTDEIEFLTTETGSESGGKVVVEVEALKPGPIGNVPANTITVINTPMTGVVSVTNPLAATGGRNKETDAEFRERYYKSLSKGGGASIPSVRAALLEVTGVIDAVVDENDSMVDSVDGVPAKSIAPFVYGGADADIAQSIFTQKAGGIKSHGSVVVDVTDTVGKIHKIGFSRPVVVNIDVKITLVKNTNFPTNGDAQVKTKVIQYIGGVDADGTEYDGQGLDADVIHYKVIAAVANVGGIDDVVVELSNDGGLTYQQANIAIAKTGIAQTHHMKVVIQ